MQLEAADGMIPFPTSVPTAPLLLGLGSLTAACQATTSASVDKVFDVQFDVAKTGSKDIVITKFQVPLDTGSHPVEVWLRHGSHKGSVAGGVHNDESSA